MDTFKKAVSTLKDRIVKSPLERSVFDACSDENWGSSNSVLHEISEKTFNHEDRQIILKCLWDLLKSPPKEWRRLYKVLNLVEHLLKFGSTACLHEIQDEAFKIRMLQDFSYREGSEEKGQGIRDKAKYLTSMLNDRKTLDEEREKAKKIWNKFTGISSDNTYAKDSWKSSYDPYIEKKYDSGEVKDIFKESEIKVQKLETKETVWDKEPGRLPAAPRVIRPPPSGNGGNIFDPVAVKKVSERADDGMFVGMNPGKGSGGVLPGQGSMVNTSAGYGSSGNVFGSSKSVPGFNVSGAFGNTGNEFINVGGSYTNPSVGGDPGTLYTGSTTSHTNTAALFTNPVTGFTNNTGANPSVSYTNPTSSHINPAPLFVNPTPSFVNPAPVYTNPAPSYTNPAPMFTNPAPSYTNPAPVYTNPAPSFTNPTPVYTNPAPSYTNPAPSYTNPAPVYTNPSPMFTNPAPSYTNPNLSYTSPSYPNPSNYSGSVNPAPGYSGYGNNSLMGINLGRSDNLSSASYVSPNPEPKVHVNIGSGSGLTMEDMKKFGNSGFTNFQSAPAEPVKVNLEQKLMNLDDLEAGQPKLKEIAKSRW